ncbi:DUF7683 domain-containing protein [Paenibacillus sp. EC2-1]|uniref:DUF7683 domain-containing protein n=1 Tax=Paenibacillus sp. EC2-1 TaxID=3388665 RepID=UPI003BEEE5FE
MKHQWRITKYNPDFRNEHGHYLLDEWTCPSEIGKIINGDLFTFEKYLYVENAYVEAIIEFLKEIRQDTLRVIQVVSNSSMSQEDEESELYEPEFSEIKIKEDMIINIDEIRTLCKMNLRNYIGFQLYSKDNFFVHFGWDYYMYIGSSHHSCKAIEFATKRGLFVEECTSPYFFEETDTTRLIQWSEIGAEVPIVIGEEVIKNVPLEEYRNIFSLSDEHPVFGYFEITKDHKDFFQSKINHKLDFTKYEYGFWAGD